MYTNDEGNRTVVKPKVSLKDHLGSRNASMCSPFSPQHARLCPPRCPSNRCPSNAYVQATPGVGSVNFCTVDFGGAFFNVFYCVPCVLPNTLVLRCMMFILCVKAALLAKRAFVACFASWFSK